MNGAHGGLLRIPSCRNLLRDLLEHSLGSLPAPLGLVRAYLACHVDEPLRLGWIVGLGLGFARHRDTIPYKADRCRLCDSAGVRHWWDGGAVFTRKCRKYSLWA